MNQDRAKLILRNMKYDIYSTIDSDYTNQSLVFFKSFTNFNPNLKLKVCCINFTDDEYRRYAEQLNSFKNIEPIRVEFKDSLSHIDLRAESHLYDHSYVNHLAATMYKLKLFSEMTADYILYLDVDMLIRSDISKLLKKYNTDFASKVYYTTRGRTINAGVLIARKGLTDLYEQSYSFFASHKNAYTPEEYYIGSRSYSITNLPTEYNWINDGSLYAYTNDPYIVHFRGSVKPFIKSTLDDNFSLTNKTLQGYFKYFNEWYTVCDSIQEVLDPEFIIEINSIKQFYNQYINLSNKIYH